MPLSTTAALVEAAGSGFCLAEVELDDPRPDEAVEGGRPAEIDSGDLAVFERPAELAAAVTGFLGGS